MAKSLVWKDLNQFLIEAYCNLASREDCYCFISDKLNLGSDEKSTILKDLYYYTLEFAKTSKFTPSQMSAYFSIIKETHRYVSANPKIMLEKDYAYFKNLVLIHSIQRPPYSEKIFDYRIMMLLLDYTTNTYFRHYLMYKYAFSKKMRMELIIQNQYKAAEEAPAATPEPISSPLAAPVLSELPPTKPDSPLSIVKEEKIDSAPISSAISPDSAHIVAKEESTRRESNPNVSSPSQNISPTPLELELSTNLPSSLSDASSVPIQFKSPKHEAAVSELKTFISSVLATKLDEIKSSVATKIQGSDDGKKDALKAKAGKK